MYHTQKVCIHQQYSRKGVLVVVHGSSTVQTVQEEVKVPILMAKPATDIPAACVLLSSRAWTHDDTTHARRELLLAGLQSTVLALWPSIRTKTDVLTLLCMWAAEPCAL